MLTAPDFAQAVTAARETGTREHFFEFEKAFGKDPLGGPAALKKRQDSGETGRFRKFAREWLAERDDSLDISWLKDDNAESSADLPEPAILATSAMEEMEAIMEDLRGILAELGEEIEEVAERMANGEWRHESSWNVAQQRCHGNSWTAGAGPKMAEIVLDAEFRIDNPAAPNIFPP
jgi:hypothetical protein